MRNYNKVRSGVSPGDNDRNVRRRVNDENTQHHAAKQTQIPDNENRVSDQFSTKYPAYTIIMILIMISFPCLFFGSTIVRLLMKKWFRFVVVVVFHSSILIVVNLYHWEPN